MTTPALTRHDAPDPHAVLLMLHGGKEHSTSPVDWRSMSWRRSHAMQRAITPIAHRSQVSTWLLRYRHRGWNDVHSPSPVPDARWALDQVVAALGDVPVVLLGHSMGARTAVHVADHQSVSGVVALAPWLPVDDPIGALRGRHLAAAHGRRDRITSSGATKRYVDRAAAVASTTEMHDMGQVGHYMLRDIAAWNEFAISRALAMLG
ncbi:alpha/beta fold hydrolase [Nocardioides sp. AE5]|uniref:alpha/beta hydrolase n=1 Tax=Nocardioides sp. AE5 TaxID=2962573 RepID=UPI002882A6D4|nr:alpha/beta fold hydrolase [Nocardioides sp. AE5]MDT0202824.1 alpha/beta fold hydrolase [Nocardioides sp. AE5]